MSVFNINNTEWEDGKYNLFMGQAPALYDSVNVNHPKLFQLYKQQVSQRWVENEFNHEQSRMDLLNCPRSVYQTMLLNLSFQWELDSVASRAIAPLFAPFVTNSELWGLLMENSNMECLVEGTEVLTPSGWKDLSQILGDEKIAQWCPVGGDISFVTPSHHFEKEYEGVVYEFSNPSKHVHQIVTPNHRMAQWSAKMRKVKFTEAEVAGYSSTTDFPVSGNLKGGDSPLTPFERFLIAAQADGTVSARYTGDICGTIPVWFGFSKDRKITRLLEICNQAGLQVRELSGSDQCGAVQAKRRFKVDVPVAQYVDVKSFSWINFENVSQQWCEDFLDEVYRWDGSVHSSGCQYYCTTIQDNAKAVQAIVHLCGKKSHFSVREDSRKETFNDSFIVSWLEGDKRSGQNISKVSLQYKGKVRCVSVPTSAFLVRYNGCVSVTGNCIHALSYSEIVRQCVPDTKEVFEMVMLNENTIKRALRVVGVFDDLAKAGAEYTLGIRSNDQQTYNIVFKGMVALYILERLQFMASFAATFAIVEQGYFQSIGKMVQKIMLDEIACHAATDAEVIRIELQTERGQVALLQCKEEILSMLEDVIIQETSWSEYLFSEGRSIVGLNPTLLNEWVMYNSQVIYNDFGFSNPYPVIKDNPLPWMKNWIDIDKHQNAMQEADGNNYALNVVKNDVAEDEEFDF